MQIFLLLSTNGKPLHKPKLALDLYYSTPRLFCPITIEASNAHDYYIQTFSTTFSHLHHANRPGHCRSLPPSARPRRGHSAAHVQALGPRMRSAGPTINLQRLATLHTLQWRHTRVES